MAKRAAGIMLYRKAAAGGFEVLLVHPGGPIWAGKEDAAWSIPKGEYGDDEEALIAAEREFAEELGSAAPPGERIVLGEVRQASGKRVQVWAVEGDFDAASAHSNTCEIEWPRNSGRIEVIAEVDRAEWFSLDKARDKLVLAQAAFVDRLVEVLGT